VRIAFITHAYAPSVGGAERYAQGLAEALAEAGQDVHVLTPARDSAEAFYEWGHNRTPPGTEELMGVTVHRIDLTPRGSWWKPRPRSGSLPVPTAHAMWQNYARTVEQKLSRLQPDATVTLPHAFPNVAATLEAPDHGIAAYAPLLHEDDPAWDADRIAELVARSDIVIALTEWERRQLADNYSSDPARTIVVPPGIDSPKPEDVESWQAAEVYVLSLGRRAASKRLPEIAETVRRLRDGGVRLKHVIAGPGSDPDVDVALLNMGDAVELLGEIDERTKWSLLKGALTTVSMSSQESFGIAAVESWRMRRPIIARDGPVSAEVVADGVSGLLVNDVAELEEALLNLYDDPLIASAMGDSGFTASAAYTWEASVAPLLNALHAESS
jgi:glycosyltransferase involved in cell wall biosynthesis